MFQVSGNNYINVKSPSAIIDSSNAILKNIHLNIEGKDEILILCIGTDRSTGDSLGPLVGHKLDQYISRYENVNLLGTLNQPVHAKNLEEKIAHIKKNHQNPLIIAIDASLGNIDKIGYINIKNAPLKPGLGVNKDLPRVGHISITGVVNAGGLMEYFVLQNTRLSLVMNMAEVIAKSIHLVLYKLQMQKRNKKLNFINKI